MMGDRESGVVHSIRAFTSHVPIPYGCLSVVALLLGALLTVAFSSIAIGIAILK
jgi:hypothetical protein